MVTEDDKKADLMRLRFPDIVKTMTVLLAVLLSAAGCSRSGAGDGRQPRRPSALDSLMSVPGDSTVYALAAAGSSDSVLVFLRLPYHGEDPDTIDVLGALQRRQVFGRAEVGDNVAILPGQGDSARCVIVTEKLAGSWCYEVSPSLRRKMGDGPLPERLQKLLEEKREYGMTMKLSGEVYTMGVYPRQADERTPVVWRQELRPLGALQRPPRALGGETRHRWGGHRHWHGHRRLRASAPRHPRATIQRRRTEILQERGGGAREEQSMT